VLESIDAKFRKEVVIDYSKMTIEHLAPQNPREGEKAASLHASVGNLILVSEDLNQKLKNKPFIEKKKLLTQAAVPMDPFLLFATSWDDKQIVARAERLAEFLSD
jgi:hypothetical protein